MDSERNVSGKFSIYKIDKLKIIEKFNLLNKKNFDLKDTDKLFDKMYNSIIKAIKSREYIELKEFSTTEFKGIYFKTKNTPDWKNLIQNMILSDEALNEVTDTDVLIENISSSYVLFYKFNDSIYVCTGGYGSTYVKQYTELYFGLYLVPKLVEKSAPVVKRILENNISGNRSSVQYANRDVTSFLVEENMGSIYKEMNVEIDMNLAKKLGINFSPNENKLKKVSIGNKDSITINRTMTIKELERVIQKINSIEDRLDNFVLSYFIPVKKIGISETELTEELIRNFLNNDIYGAISIVGDEYDKYYFDANKYQVALFDGTILLERDEPITTQEVFQAVIEMGKKNLGMIRSVLKKATISTFDSSGQLLLYPIPIIKAIQGLIEVDNKTYYIFNGNWYVFNPKYITNLSDQFKDVNKTFGEQVKTIKDKFKLGISKTMTENQYNDSFLNNDKFLFSHTTKLSNVEISDIIFWDDTNLYLMCNKSKFSGEGARDLTNQILTSADFLQKMLGSGERVNFIDRYYDALKAKAKVKNSSFTITRDEFTRLFNKRICYIAGFIENYKDNSESTYGKFLIYETFKILTQKSYGFIALNCLDK